MKPLHILLLGNKGQLGWELERTLSSLGTISAYDFPEIDLTQEHSLRQLIGGIQPNLIVNATAYTAVDRAESEPELAYAVNQDAPRIMAEEAQILGSALVHFSTDYVFDGTGDRPYSEQDTPNPLNVYGQSKLAGEKAIQGVGGAYMILRTSWVYSLRRDSFVTKVMQWARQHRELRLVTDQVSCPTWCRALAEATAQMLVKGSKDIYPWFKKRTGLYHLAGSGYASRLEWGLAVLRSDPHRDEHVVDVVSPASTDEFPTPARRPLFTPLNCDLFTQTFDLRLPDWEAALRLAMDIT